MNQVINVRTKNVQIVRVVQRPDAVAAVTDDDVADAAKVGDVLIDIRIVNDRGNEQCFALYYLTTKMIKVFANVWHDDIQCQQVHLLYIYI